MPEGPTSSVTEGPHIYYLGVISLFIISGFHTSSEGPNRLLRDQSDARGPQANTRDPLAGT